MVLMMTLMMYALSCNQLSWITNLCFFITCAVSVMNSIDYVITRLMNKYFVLRRTDIHQEKQNLYFDVKRHFFASKGTPFASQAIGQCQFWTFVSMLFCMSCSSCVHGIFKAIVLANTEGKQSQPFFRYASSNGRYCFFLLLSCCGTLLSFLPHPCWTHDYCW